MKMPFSKLEYVALEGGGGKGAVYKGAIVALERLFDGNWKNGGYLKMAGGELTQPEAADASEEVTEGTSILDYYVKEGELKIKGISGASAGAITAFPLALGLTSDDIGTILTSYQFSDEFLPNHKLHVGKYRMVGMDRDGKARLLVGEDHFRKLGEDNVAVYQIPLSGNDRIGDNKLKDTVRSYVIAAGFSVIFTGLKEQWAPISKGARVVSDFLAKYNFIKRGSEWLKSNVVSNAWSQVFANPRFAKFATSLTPVPLNSALKALLLLPWFDINRLPWGSKNQMKIKGVLPKDNVVSAVANIVWDRGIYAGFEIRELFFRILILAISKDTHFSRELQKREGLLGDIGSDKREIKHFTASFNDKFEIEVTDECRKTLVKLTQLQEKLTFRELYEISKVHLAICVTNSTTNQPIYFSHYFTPDFPVLEAVGASMSFPLAFKPVYNEANVLLNDEKRGDGKGGESTTRMFLNPSDYVKFQRHGQSPIVYKEAFSMREYNKHLGIVLAYIKGLDDLGMSVNGNISFRSFLPYLRAIIENERFAPFEVKDHVLNKYETYDAGYIKALCYFYYNSAFKGLLIDGGVTNNLPIAVFTFNPKSKKSGEIQDLDIKTKVLSLKLDNSFPEVIRKEVFESLKKDPKTFARLMDWGDEAVHYNFAERIFKGRKFRNALRKDQKASSLGREVWIKVSRELVQEYKNSIAGFTPWNKEINAVASLLGSLQFGFDQGQIESIDDNENIIPLYCYGLTTFDFDLASEKAEPLVQLAVEEGRKAVEEYFKDAGSDPVAPGQ